MKFQKIKLTEEQKAELESFMRRKGRSFSEGRRVIAILLLDKNSPESLITELTGYSSNYVFKIRKKYLTKGTIGLHDRKKAKPRALLTKGQREEIVQFITTTAPRAHGYESDEWATSILGEMIKEKYNVQYKSKTSLYILFRKAKFTYHKPGKQYKKRSQERIDQWIKERKDTITQEMNDENAVVLFEDEMMLRTETTTQKIWLPKGHFPKIDVSSTRKVRAIYGFLNIKTGREHAFKSARADSDETITCLEKIGALYPDKKIVIIWDNAIFHRSKKIKSYLSTTKYHFHLIALPTYSPELNPQEHVWKTGRLRVTHNTYIPNIDKATDELIEFLNTF